MIELLEPRVAPATLVSPTTLTYTDVDGDVVTVKFSKPLLTEANVNSVFTFSTGTVNGSNSIGQLLQRINLESFGSADGLGISVIAKRGSTGGDGLANVGEIDARVGVGNGLDLGKVVIDGDLGQLRCGDESSPLPGLVSLKADSLGILLTNTQLPGSAALLVEVAGLVGSITVKGDSYVRISIPDNSLGKLTLGGSLFATDEANGVVAGAVGKIVIGGDIAESSISIESVGSIVIGGSIRGTSIQQGYIAIAQGAKSISVAGDVIGEVLVPANGGKTGYIAAGGRIEKLSIGGSLIGTSMPGVLRGGSLSAASFGKIVVGGDIDGGRIQSVGTSTASDGADIGSVFVGGSLIGIDLGNTGSIEAGTFNNLNLPLKTGKLGKVIVKGSLVSSSIREFTAQIVSTSTMGSVSVGGDLVGASGPNSARIVSFATLGKVTVGGSVQGSGASTGLIAASGDIGTISIGQDLAGGGADLSGRVFSITGSIASVKIGGSVRGVGAGSGVISAGKNLGSVSIGEDLVGGDFGAAPGSIFANGSISSVKIGGSVLGGTAFFSGSIRANEVIGSINIKGSILGNTTGSGAIVARGHLNPANESAALAIGSITVGGRIGGAGIYAGYSADTFAPVNADVQIGKIVCGTWLASNAVAGVTDGGNGFGNAGDVAINSGGISAIISKIGSVIIKGHARGTFGGTDSFGIVAQEIGSVRISDAIVKLTAGRSNDMDLSSLQLALGTTGDFRVREIA